MPSHRDQASSAPSFISRPATRKPLGTLLNCTGPSVMQRKSRPTCALSVANVSACRSPPSTHNTATSSDSMVVDVVSPSDVDVNLLPVPISPRSPEDRSKAKAAGAKPRSHRSRHQSSPEINVIPFPTSTQTSDTLVSVPPSTTNQLSTHHALLRTSALPVIVNRALSRISSAPRTPSQIKQKLASEKSARSKNHEAPLPASSAPPPRKRARKGSISSPSKAASPLPASDHPPKASLITEPIPPRPSSPTPEDRNCTSPSPDAMMTDRNGPPPYSPNPPPYSPCPPTSEEPVPVEDPKPVVIHAPKPVRSPNTVVTPSTEPTSSEPRVVPVTTPAVSPPPPPPPRRYRIPTAEAQLLIALCRTLEYGIEGRRYLYTRCGQARPDFIDWTSAAALEAYFKYEDGEDAEPPVDCDLEEQDARLWMSLTSFLRACGVGKDELEVYTAHWRYPGRFPPPTNFDEMMVCAYPYRTPEEQIQDESDWLPPEMGPNIIDPIPEDAPKFIRRLNPARPSPSATHLVANFTLRSRGRPRHYGVRPKPRGRPLGPSSLRNQVQLDVDPFAVVIEEEL